MRRFFAVAPVFLASIVLHAAAIGFVMWGDARGVIRSSANLDVLLGELPTPVSKSSARPRVRRLRHEEVPQKPAALEAPTTEDTMPSAESANVTANEILDLSSLQTHPYFARLSKILSEAKQGLLPSEGRSEQFTIQLGIGDTGQIRRVRIIGDDSQLKLELSDRMARVGFLPRLPKEVLFGKDEIEIRYRVSFPFN